MVHITDLHFDFDYTIGTKAVCDSPLTGCCRPESGIAGEGELGARQWGEYMCDSPR